MIYMAAGLFPTFCAAIVSAGQAHIAERLSRIRKIMLTQVCYYRGVAVSQEQDEDDVMNTGESGAQSPTPPSKNLPHYLQPHHLPALYTHL